jgi:hypothetical protein
MPSTIMARAAMMMFLVVELMAFAPAVVKPYPTPQ